MSYAEHLGIVVLRAGPDEVTARLTVEPSGTNMHGTAHGGLLFSLADEVFAVISNQEAQAVAVDTHFSVFRPARPGDTVWARGTPLRVGRSLATYRVELYHGEGGDLIALFQGTVSRRPR